MSTETSLHQTPLVEEHIALAAKMVGFGGWQMPLQYDGIIAEWDYNRKGCSIFDCSHMGEFLIKGDAKESGLDRLVTQGIADMPLKTCRYGALLNEAGGVIDDLIVYRKAADEWMIVVNAANIEKDAAHFKAHLNAAAVFEDRSFNTAKLDLQGPLSRDVLKAFVPGITGLTYYTFDEFNFNGIPCLISRTGYTGELGYEIYCPWEKAKEIWKCILKNDTVKPTGLGVRDVLRIEMCYALYGHELDEGISPLTAGLEKFIDFNKDFIGKGILLAQQKAGIHKKLFAIASTSRRSPRVGHQVMTSDGRVIGKVVSGTFSPGLQVGIGMAFMDASSSVGMPVTFGDEKIKSEAVISKRPFYKNGSLKN